MEVGPSAEEAMKLNIPRIASNPENTGVKSGLLMQTYKDFAIEIKRKNSNVSFSRDVLDTAFRISTTRLPKHAGGGYQQDKQTMIDRVSSTTGITITMLLTVECSVSARNLRSTGRMPRDWDSLCLGGSSFQHSDSALSVHWG